MLDAVLVKLIKVSQGVSEVDCQKTGAVVPSNQ